MSVLLVGLDEERGPAVVAKLLAEDDIVGVIEEQAGRGDKWRDLGAHVAIGSPDDADLIERAAQHARSIVVFEHDTERARQILAAVLEGARLVPGEAARIIYVADAPPREIVDALRGSAFDYVLLRLGRRGRLVRRRPTLEPEDLAEAINAADDLAGDPRLDVDPAHPDGRRALGLEVP